MLDIGGNVVSRGRRRIDVKKLCGAGQAQCRVADRRFKEADGVTEGSVLRRF